ncbi:PAS domain S-box protein [Spirosoma sp. SC4-14]|uniref:PAS domain S-box protein n=1 Tax=Spirosoma sp. SC4-14 TaxID=3128900 RepID=UPI0030CC6ECA
MPVLTAEKKRLEALRQYQILDTPPDKEFDQLADLASLICQTPISLISLVDEKRQWFKSRIGIDLQETHRDIAFCNYTIQDQGLFEVEDAQEDNRFKENPLVLTDPHIRFYAGYPLTDSNGHALGALCVLDREPRKLTPHQQKALQILGDMAMGLISTYRQKQELLYLENLFTLSNDLICIASTDGFFKRINPAFSKVLGWDTEFLLETSFFELVHPDDLQLTIQQIQQLADGEPTINFAHRIRCKDGDYRYLQWTASPEPHTGYLFAIARDISEEKQKESLLHQSEAKFRSFFENSQGFLCIHDLEGKLLTVNMAGASALGYEPEELVGLTLHQIVPPNQHEGLAHYLKIIRETGKASGLMHTRHRDGSLLIWLFNNVLEQAGTDGAYVIGNAIDITRRHQLEVDLKQTKQMLEQTNEAARIGTWEFDVAGNRLSWSSVTKAIHEVPADFEPTLDIAISFFTEAHKDRIRAAVQEAIQQEVLYDLELQIRTATGREIWVRSIGTPELEKGVCKRLYGTFQDIDERKKGEQALLNEKLRLMAFVEHAPAAVAMFDRQIRYIAVSKRWMEDYHLTESVIGRSHYDIFPDISDEWKAIHARCAQGAVEKNEEDIWHPEGWDHDQYLRWEVRPWYQFDGSIGGIMMFTQDITEMCLQRDELKKAKLLAEQASVAKSEFLANMSHEIRTPLNGVIGFTDLVLKTSLTSTQHQYLSIVNQSANALLSIINDILDFSKIEAGKLELAPERVDLYEICGQATDIITYQAQQKGLEILLNIPSDLPRFIYVDSVRLKQVLVNLLGNAVKFTEKGEIELQVKPLTDIHQPEIRYLFEVRDTGIGIKTDMQERIFEAFAQEEPSITKKYGGTGLGLTISNKLVDLMGGQLNLRSKVNEGSCFFFSIPLPVESGPPVTYQGIEQIHSVLIVDDNANNRIILKHMLALKQITVEEASNGFEALQLLSVNNNYDVILMDYHMPFMDGLETIEKIQANFVSASHEQIPILLHSSSDDDRIIRGCETLGIRHRLVKPIKMDELYQTLARLTQQDERPIDTLSDQPVSIHSDSVKILLVEDNKINQLLARTFVSRIIPNAHIIEAENGEQAVEAYHQHRPDLILMDVQMPVMNGYEATRQIRSSGIQPPVPILALTAGSIQGEREKCFAAGMDDFLTKPVSEEALADALQKWLIRPLSSSRITPVNETTNVHFDPHVLHMMAGGDPDFYAELVDTIRLELQATVAILQTEVSAESVPTLRALGHKLRGSASSAGMENLAQLAHQMETTAEINPDGLIDLQNQMLDEIALLLTLLTPSSPY